MKRMKGTRASTDRAIRAGKWVKIHW